MDLRLTEEAAAAAALKAAAQTLSGGIEAAESNPAPATASSTTSSSALAYCDPPSETAADRLPLNLDLEAFKFLQVCDDEYQSRREMVL